MKPHDKTTAGVEALVQGGDLARDNHKSRQKSGLGPRRRSCGLCWAAGTMLLLALAGLAPAQEAAPEGPPDAAEPAAGADEAKPNALPKMGELLTAIDDATQARPEDEGGGWSAPVRLAVVFAGLALLPSLLIMMTSFTRIVIVLAFVRRALTTQNIPPTIAIIGLALFLTIFTMAPTLGQINEQAVKPYTAKAISFQVAVDRGSGLLKDFMLRHTRAGDLKLFLEMAKIENPTNQADVPTHVAIPAFAISEFRTAFEMGCLLFIPFLLVDLVVAGILLSAGMMMLPPAIISLPFKIILFVLVDGWHILAKTLVLSFQ